MKYEHLVGRPFVWGEADCFALGRDFFHDNFGIDVTDYARPTSWSSDKMDLIRLFHEKEGFEMLTDWRAKDLRPGDVLCMSIGSSAPNHFAIFVGDNTLIHHVYGRYSTSEPYRDFWRNCTAFVLRHPDVPDTRPVFPDTDIMSLINARNDFTTKA